MILAKGIAWEPSQNDLKSAERDIESRFDTKAFQSQMIIGPATRCDEIEHFAAILLLLEASQPIAAHRMYLLQIRSSVASHLPTMGCFPVLLRCSLLRWK